MTMKPPEVNRLPALVASFFRDYLVNVRGASTHTIRAYRDTLRLWLLYLSDTQKRSVAELCLGDLQADGVMAFLVYLESQRANSAATRNCRLAALRAFFKHLIRQDPTRAEQYYPILSLPAKKAKPPPAAYLEPEDVRLILAKPDRRTLCGRRDHALLLFLYNTGARVSEALAVRACDINFATAQVRLHGKGRKDRFCPLWRETLTALRYLPAVANAKLGNPLFISQRGEPLSRDGVAYILRKYVKLAAREAPALGRRRIAPHVLRHRCAVALLQAGVDVTVIRDYLGHASVATTSRYITTNLAIRREALEAFWSRAGIPPARSTPWEPKPDLLAFLNSL